MGFFLLGKLRDSGALKLISDSLFESRQDAIDALSGIDVPPDLESEVFAVDIDAATPVVVVQKKAAAEVVADDAIADTIVDEAHEAELLEETAAEAPDTLEAPAEELAGEVEGAGLHDALKGAAASLEGEGIVAPDSVGPTESEAKAWPWDSGEAPVADEDTAEADLDQALADSSPVETAVVEAPAEDPVIAEEPVAEFVPDPLEEPAVSVGDMVSTPGSEEIDASRPVIMGAYGAASSAPEVADDALGESEVHITEDLPFEPVFEETVAEPINVKARDDLESVLADLEISEPMGAGPTEENEELPQIEVPAEMAAEIPAAPVVAEDAVAPEQAEVIVDTAPEAASVDAGDLLAEAGLDTEPADEAGFAGGDSDLSDLTCEDCVYMNTCPKQGESTPASCGSFQWKSS